MSLSRLALIFSLMATYASFTWAIKRFFRVPATGMPPKMKALAVGGSVAMLANIIGLAFPAYNAGPGVYAGLFGYFCSLSIFWWAINTNHRRPLSIAFAEMRPDHLVVEGPYRFVRHPFYVSYMCAWFAGAISTGRLSLLIPAAAMSVFYFQAAKEEESWFLQSQTAEAYARYRSRVGMFFPKILKNVSGADSR